jgi:transglutaminase-like putative cysteine protease/tetratricopeptide (TPR) repeat protein
MLFFARLPLTLALLLLCLVSAAGFAQPVKGTDQLFDVEYSLTFKNRGREKAAVRLTVPVPRSDIHQELLKLDCSPSPVKVEKRPQGDFAHFLLPPVEGGKAGNCRILMKMRSRRIIHMIDGEKVSGQIPGPARVYLKATPRYPAGNAKVAAALKKIVGDESNPYYRAIKIYDYVRGLRFQLSEKPKSVLQVLETGTCQCSDASDLMVTLCRAAGIPARFVGGVFLKESEDRTGETHAWVEIYVHPYGWLPADPTMSRFNYFTRLSRFAEIDSPYITLWRDDEAPYLLSPARAGGRIKGRLEKIVKYKALMPRKGVEVKKIYPKFSTDLSGKNLNYDKARKSAATRAFKEVEIAVSAGEDDKARKLLRKVIRLDGGYDRAYVALFELSAKEGRVDSLKTEMESLQKDREKRAGASLVLGIIYGNERKYSRAMEEYKNARGAGLNSALIDFHQGGLMLDLKEVRNAAVLLGGAHRQDPYHLRTYSYLFDLFNYLEDFGQTVRLCKLGLAVSNLPDFHYQMANSYFFMGKYREGEEAALKAVAAAPDQGIFLATLGKIHVKMGKKEQGQDEIRKGIKLGVTPDEQDELQEFMGRLASPR